MEFIDIFNEEKAKQNSIFALEKEVKQLQAVLVREQALNRVLTSAMQGPLILPQSDSYLIPPHVQVILAELVMVEEEIIMLEKKAVELKIILYQERKKTAKRELQRQRKHKKLADDPEQLSKCLNYEKILRKGKMVEDKMSFSGPLLGFQNMSSARPNDKSHFHRRIPSGEISAHAT